MSQPTPYDRAYSFTDFSSGSPSSQPPGVQIDAELDAVGETLADVLANLALIQRDDGALRNGAVGVDQLNSTALALISGSAFNVAGPWATLTAYSPGDIVSDASVVYLVMETHVAGALATDVAAGRLVSVFDAAAVALETKLALATGLGLIGTSTGVDAQTALDAKASKAALLASTGLATIGEASGITAQAALDAKVATADLASTDTGKGDALIGHKLDATGAAPRTVHDKLGEIVSIADFGASEDATAAVNTAAIHAAMAYRMDRFAGSETFYPAGPGEPTTGGLVDYERRDRRTGEIYIPSGRFMVLPEVFSSLVEDRAPFVGFTFTGADQNSSVLMLETGGAEAWFYKTDAANERYQKLVFQNLTFMADDWRYGNFMEAYSAGVAKQTTAIMCRFIGLQRLLSTKGIGNADLNRFLFCWIEHYAPMLTLDNDQSVQHDFINCEFRSWATQVLVKQSGGGNVSIKNSSMDLIWDERISPVGGTYLFEHEADSNIGQGNCTFKWEDCRIEIEAFMTSAGNPELGIAKTVDNAIAFPRLALNNVNFVNGRTYALDGSGVITDADGEFRRITAFEMWPGKNAHLDGCVLLKNFFYEFNGSRDTDSPNGGGIVHIENSFDGTLGELPAADSTKDNIHSRAIYGGSAGRLITNGMREHTTGSSFVRKVLDADPRWQYSFGREPASTVKRIHFKHTNNGWPAGANSGNDAFLDLPDGIKDARFYVNKPASGVVTDTYQLHLKATDRSGALIATGAESVSAQFKDAHTIDIGHVDLTGITRIALCASGTATEFQEGGVAYIEYV